MSQPCSSRRALLRTATAAAHRKLDALASRLDLTDVPDYCRFLIANAGPLAALEIALERCSIETLLPDWTSRARRHALAQDLQALGLQVALPSATNLASRSAALGVAYVLEGSRVGAQSILQRIKSNADSRVLSASRFLHASHSTLWPSFLRILESTDRVDSQALTQSAVFAFEMFHDSFATLSQCETPSCGGRLVLA